MNIFIKNSKTAAVALPVKTAEEVRQSLLDRREIALLDVREEAFHAEGHPLFAANLPLSRIEFDAFARLPRRNVPVVLIDDGEGYATVAGERLAALGYTDVSILQGGLQGWRDAGFEIFCDVNAPSKAFGELVEAKRHTPSLSAQEVKALIDIKADIAIVDARRYEEFHTMSIPTAVSIPGGELVYRLYGLVEKPETCVIVNCAGRTRSIIGTQSLINAGLPNVAALRNGTIGWKLAHQTLDHGATPQAPTPSYEAHARAVASTRQLADATSVKRVSLAEVLKWRDATRHTVYLFDVRTPAEFSRGHLTGFRSAPGGQLVQETDMFAPVRGARIVLADDDGVRANMTASWLSQMGWGVYVVDGLRTEEFSQQRVEAKAIPFPKIPEPSHISATTLKQWMELGRVAPYNVVVLDFSHSRSYRKTHIPGAWYALRSRIDEALHATAGNKAYVVTAQEEADAIFAWDDLNKLTSKPIYWLAGGNEAWQRNGYLLTESSSQFASQPVDYYRRPYEGTEASPASMQAYLEWEFGLVEQLARDGTHGFSILERTLPDD